ncbi:MAG TPA: Maf family protein [Candidatus Chromulinivoraceae bacterium]|nr:Maf family protein [Candidatus Chromulinivoraceae bacterium]
MIILASNSWLRKTILEASGLPFEIHVRSVDERDIEASHQDKSDEQIATILARTKSEAVWSGHQNDLVIAADTLTLLPDGRRLHKPSSAKEAIELCLLQSGKTIRAMTGVAMTYRGKTITNVCATSISYIDFDEKTIRKLLEGNDFTIRNAGLGFFLDAPGFTLVESFEGSYTGAMGLPMEIVRKNLRLLDYRA